MLRSFLQAITTVLGRELNQQQIAAVEASSDRSLFLVAGPGSGKTTVLALRVLKLILVDEVEPTAVIATTFTRKAAKELRSRILGWGDQVRAQLRSSDVPPGERARIANIDFNAVWTGTFDSFAETVLGEYRAPGAQPPAVVEEFVAQALMLRQGLFDQQRFRDGDLTDYLALLRGSNFGLTTAAKASMLNDVRQRLLHDDVDLPAYLAPSGVTCGLCPTHPHPGVALVGEALASYERFLAGAGIVDYAALEFSLLQQLRSGGLNSFLGTIEHVLVDEYQDTNLLQEQIYSHIASNALPRGGSITVVGDDDQALYRFRGATVELFRDYPSRASVALGMAPSTIFLLDNYRSTNAIVDFCNDYLTLDSQFQSVRVANKPSIRPNRGAGHNVAVLGMFRDTPIQLARDLASFVESVFTGGGYQVPSGELIQADPGGNVGDCALLTFSPAERKNGRDRLPRLLRQELSTLSVPISLFNPRGTDLADIPAVRQLCGLALECIDPAGNVQASMRTLPRATTATLDAWRADALNYASSLSGTARISLQDYITSWQARIPRSVSSWPDRIGLADLAYKLVTWIPPMQRDVEGLVHFEVVLRTITEGARFSTYGASIVFRDNTWQERSIKAAIRDIFSPLADGAIDIDEDLLDTLPLDRLNVLSIHQSKGLEFPLVIVDVGSDFTRNHAAQAFQRFPTDGALTHRLEDELRLFSRSLLRPNRSGQDRAFDDLIRSYFVAFSRAQDVLMLVGLAPVADGRVRSIAAGWDRTGAFRWGTGLPNLEMI